MGDFLVVRVVADLAGGERERAGQVRPRMAEVEIGLGPVDAVGRIERQQGVFQAGQDRRAAQLGGGAGHRDLRRPVARPVGLMMGGATEKRGRDEHQLDPLVVVEGVGEPAQRVAVLIAVLRHGKVGRMAGFQYDLGGADLDHVDQMADRLAR